MTLKSQTPVQNRRTPSRSKLASDAFAWVQALPDTPNKSPESRNFKPTSVALVTEESGKGCGLVLLATTLFKVGDVCRIRVRPDRRGPSHLAEVRWRSDVDGAVIRIGVMYL